MMLTARSHNHCRPWQDWFGGMGVLDFLRSVGKHARVNVMMSRESVKQRLARDEGISFTEYVPRVGAPTP